MYKRRKPLHGATDWTRADHTRELLMAIRKDLGLTQKSDYDIAMMPMPDPYSFSCPEQFRTAYWQAEVLSKAPMLKTGVDTKSAAMLAFREYEGVCAEFNSRLVSLWERPIPEGTRAILKRARSILNGLFEGFSKDEVIHRAAWSPGATTSRKRRLASPQNKWLAVGHVTRGALPYFAKFAKHSGWVLTHPIIVDGNRVTVVAKNAKTDRTIAIEPDWNMFFQHGLGDFIRSRLNRVGLLRPDAQKVQQILARQGSADGFLCTIDLKGASDTVSLAIVEALFPALVFETMCELRSPVGELDDGTQITYEKISSMGNGFTFELETALFYAIAKAASGHASVFGDDIIVASSAYEQVVSALNFCGFTVNLKKSHYGDSPFRESCGGHFFKGVDVTPPYVKKRLVGPRLVDFLNSVSRVSSNGFIRHSPLRESWQAGASRIPRYLYGPENVDGCLHHNYEECDLVFSRKLFRCVGRRFVEKPDKRARAPGTGALRHALYNDELSRAAWVKHPNVQMRVFVTKKAKPIWWEVDGRFPPAWA